MSLSNSRAAYLDAYVLLDKALEEPRGLRVEIIEGRGAANHFRMRIHQARQIDRNENAKTYPDPNHHLHGRSPYDLLVCRIESGPAGTWLYLDKQKVEIGVVESIPEGYRIEGPEPTLQIEYQPQDAPQSNLTEGPTRVWRGPQIRRR